MFKHPVILGVVALLAVVGLATGKSIFLVLVAAAFAFGILRIGVVMLGGLRKVRLLYRCSICGTEVRMTAANDEQPEAPRHCLEDMDVVAPSME
jgi:hypothetical protein